MPDYNDLCIRHKNKQITVSFKYQKTYKIKINLAPQVANNNDIFLQLENELIEQKISTWEHTNI